MQLLLPFQYIIRGRHQPINPAMMVAGSTNWVSQHLETLIRPLRTSTGLGAFTIPTEIILMIASHLNRPSVTCLALTCRTLHSICFPKDRLMNTIEKQDLLLLLEKDVASLYFCHYCVKLHGWHSRWSKSISPWYEERESCKRSADNHLFLSFTCHIPYYLARLVMNRHFYGPAHGPPPYKLVKRARSSHHSDGVVKSMSQQARIVDDQLLVLSIGSIFHARGDSTSLRSHIDSLGHPVCEHFTIAEGWLDHAPMQLPELVKDETTPNLFLPCDKAFGSCTFCLTDYTIDISWQGEKNGFVVKVSIYHQLGDCRSPFEWPWHTISTRRTKEELRMAHPLKHGPGHVRDQWNKADSVESTTHGEWVEILEWVAGRRRDSLRR
jgi:hypothetical protein